MIDIVLSYGKERTLIGRLKVNDPFAEKILTDPKALNFQLSRVFELPENEVTKIMINFIALEEGTNDSLNGSSEGSS